MAPQQHEKGLRWYHKLACIVVMIGSLILVDSLRQESRLKSARERFHLTPDLSPQQAVDNEFYAVGDVIKDGQTGFMWQQAGAPEEVPYRDAQHYITRLNQERFAGYDDWRLPTVQELLSITEIEKQTNDLYIDPLFHPVQDRCWSAQTLSFGLAAWMVSFQTGRVAWSEIHPQKTAFVRAVRSCHPGECQQE